MIRLSALISVACVTATTAEPLAIAAECAWDAANQQINAIDSGGDPVFPASVGGPFVTWDAYGTSEETVVQNCANGNYLIVVYPGATAASEQVGTLMNEMLWSETGYTLKQMGEAVAPFGAGARMGNGDIGRCGCETIGY